MVAMLMVFGLASFAAAEVALSGDARVRGVSQGNFDHNSVTDDDSRYYDHRIRLKIVGSNDDGAGVKLRVTMAEEKMDEADIVYELRYDGDDYAYMYVPVAENWILSAGYMPGDWGHRLWGWGQSHQRVKIEGNLDGLIIGYWNQKDDETFGSNDLKDYESNSVWVVAPVGEFTVGATIKMSKDDRVSDPGTAVAAIPDSIMCEELYSGAWDNGTNQCYIDAVPGSDGDTGTEIDVFFTGKAGDITIKGELAQLSGDLFGDDAQTGIFLGAGMDMDALKLSGAIAMTKNGYTANRFFTPTVLIGTAQPTAALDLGQNPEGGCAPCAADTTALVLGVGTKLSDEMGVGAKVMYAVWDNYPDDGNGGNLTELDATFSYALGENTSFSAALGYGSLSFDNDTEPDDSLMAIGWSLNTSF